MKRAPHIRVVFSVILFLVLASTGLAARDRVPGETWLRYATPEEAGFSSGKLAEAREYWESTRSSAVFVVYRGAVLVDWGETARRFRCHSVRKSFMSGLYGVYIDNGSIDRSKTMEQLGIDDEPPLTDEERQTRIVDLLSARSGVYRLAAYEPPQNPKPPRGSHPPGTNWVYNNWDFNTLVTILEQETGIKLFEEFDERFAKPLQMQDYAPSHGYYHYERDKSIHPAYPFRMSARDMARFGLLYLYEGRWGRERILSSEYVEESTSWISDTPSGGYGYMWWRHDTEPFKSLGMFSALGVGGQSIEVIPGAEMVFVNRANTYEDGAVGPPERYRMIQMILDARVGEPRRKPALEPIPDPPAGYEPQPLTAAEKAPYIREYPIPNTELTVRIFDRDGQLMIEFGEGPIPFHDLGPDHFIIEDHNEHIYFEQSGDGSRELIAADLLLMHGRASLEQGSFDGALGFFEKAERYYPEDPRVYRSIAETHLRAAGQSVEAAIAGYRKVNELRPDETLDRSLLAWELISLQARVMPPELPASRLERLAGKYGPRLVEFEDGQLYYSRDGNPRVKLTPQTETIFAHETIDWFRVRFDAGEDGRVFRITGLYLDGRRDESLRDP